MNLEEGFPVMEHNQYTFEGEIEQMGILARGINRVRRNPDAPSSKRAVAVVFRTLMTLFAVFVLASLVFGIAGFLLHLG